MSRRRRILLRLTALVLGLVLGVLAIEGAALLYLYTHRVRMATDLFVPAEDLRQAYRMAPGYHSPDDGSIPVRVNGLGLRGPDIPPPEAGEFRILCLGDSVTFGFGVTEQQAFCIRLGQLLNRASPLTVRAINAGVAGYNAENCLGQLQAVGPVLRPQLVLYTAVVNDLDDSLYPDQRRYLYAQRHPDLVDRHYSSATWLWDAGFYSKDAIVWQGGPLHHLWVLFRALVLREPNALVGGLPDWHTPFVQGLSPASRERWGRFARTLAEMKAEAELLGAGFRLVVFPPGLQGRPLQILTSIAEQQKVDTLDLLPTLGPEDEYLRRLALPLDPHPNPEGHRIIAEDLARWLAPGLPGVDPARLPPPPSDPSARIEAARERQQEELAEQRRRSSTLAPLIAPIRREGILQIDSGIYPDGWVVDQAIFLLGLPPGDGPVELALRGWTELTHLTPPLRLSIWLDGRAAHEHAWRQSGPFELRLPVPERPRELPLVEVRLEAQQTFCPKRLGLSGDTRNLSVGLNEAALLRTGPSFARP